MVKTNKRATETFLVAKASVTTLVPANNTLTDSTTLQSGVADGQLGFTTLKTSFGAGLFETFKTAAGDVTVSNFPNLTIVQGLSEAAASVATNPYPLNLRRWKTSAPISKDSDVLVTKQPFALALHETWVLPSTALTVTDETEYEFFLNIVSHNNRSTMSSTQNTGLRVTNVTPLFASGLAANLKVDWLLQQSAWDVNRNSLVAGSYGRVAGKFPVVALAVATSGTTGTLVSSLTVGQVLNLTAGQGFNRTLTITEEIKASIDGSLASGDYILTNNVTTAGTSTNGIASKVLFLSLNNRPVFVDYRTSTFNRIDLFLTKGFANTVIPTNPTHATDGQGYGRSLNLWYKATEGQRLYNLRHTCDPVIEYPSDILDNEKYVVYNILHSRVEQVDTFNSIYSPLREIVLIPRYSTGTTAHPAIALFDTALNAWLASAGKPSITTN